MSRRSRKLVVEAVPVKVLEDGISNHWKTMQDSIVQLTLAYFKLMYGKEEMSLPETTELFAGLDVSVESLVIKMSCRIFNDLDDWIHGRKFRCKLGTEMYSVERSVQCSNWDGFLQSLLRCDTKTYLADFKADVTHCLHALIGLAADFLFYEADSDPPDVVCERVLANLEVHGAMWYLVLFKDGVKRGVQEQYASGMVGLVDEYWEDPSMERHDLALLKTFVKKFSSGADAPGCSTDSLAQCHPEVSEEEIEMELEEQEEEVEVELEEPEEKADPSVPYDIEADPYGSLIRYSDVEEGVGVELQAQGKEIEAEVKELRSRWLLWEQACIDTAKAKLVEKNKGRVSASAKRARHAKVVK